MAEGVFLAPRAWSYQVENAIDSFHEEAPGDICNAPGKDPGAAPLNVATAVSFVAFYPLRFLSVPFIQSFGTSAWEMMKRRAELVFAREKALHTDPAVPHIKEGTGRILMKALRERIPQAGMWKPKGRDAVGLDIILVGFSMGGFLVNRLLQEFADLHFDRILYLGAASSINDFEASVIPYLRQHKDLPERGGAEFWSFAIAEADEAAEISYLDVYERGSLLVWIDNYFERINAPTQRTFGRWKNLRLYFKTPKEFDPEKRPPGQIFLVKFDGHGWNDPRRHGDFDEPPIFDHILQISNNGGCFKDVDTFRQLRPWPRK